MVKASEGIELGGVVTAYIAVEHTQHIRGLHTVTLADGGIDTDVVLRIVHLVGTIGLANLLALRECFCKAIGHALQLFYRETVVVLHKQFNTVAEAIARHSGHGKGEHIGALDAVHPLFYLLYHGIYVVVTARAFVPVLQLHDEHARIGTVTTQNVPSCNGRTVLYLVNIGHFVGCSQHRLLGLFEGGPRRGADVNKHVARILVGNETRGYGVDQCNQQNEDCHRCHYRQPFLLYEQRYGVLVFPGYGMVRGIESLVDAVLALDAGFHHQHTEGWRQ